MLVNKSVAFTVTIPTTTDLVAAWALLDVRAEGRYEHTINLNILVGCIDIKDDQIAPLIAHGTQAVTIALLTTLTRRGPVPFAVTTPTQASRGDAPLA